MTPEPCPFHHVDDNCAPMARLLEQAGLLTPTPNAPAMRRAPGPGIPAVPDMSATIRAVADRINEWGRSQIDPTIPHLDGADERSVRYALQAISETAATGESLSDWYRVAGRLQEASLRASVGARADDNQDAALAWYIAALLLERAHQVWEDKINKPLKG